MANLIQDMQIAYTQQDLEARLRHVAPIEGGFEADITPQLALYSISCYLKDSGYNIGGIEFINDGNQGYIHLNTEGGKEKKVQFRIRRWKGYTITLEDDCDPYICDVGQRLEFKFSKKGCFVNDGKGQLVFDPHSIYESHIEKSISIEKGFYDRFFHGDSKQLRKLYKILPELKYLINRGILDRIAETILNFTTTARVIQHLGSESWYIYLSALASSSMMGAERFYARRALKITGDLPGAIFASLVESPQNVISRVTERRDIVSWQRLRRCLEAQAQERGKLREYKQIQDRLLELEQELKSSKGRVTIRKKLGDDGFYLDERLSEVISELEMINYGEISKEFEAYAQQLSEQGLLRDGATLNGDLESLLHRHADMDSATFRKSITDAIRKAIREPNPEELRDMIEDVRKSLRKNIGADLGIFISNYPLAYMASKGVNIPTWAFVFYYLGINTLNVINSVGYVRLSNIIYLNYTLKELEKDPTVSSGSDLYNQWASQMNFIESAIFPLVLVASAAGQFASQRTGGITNYAMDVAALGIKLLGVRQWYKFMNGLRKRCDRQRGIC